MEFNRSQLNQTTNTSVTSRTSPPSPAGFGMPSGMFQTFNEVMLWFRLFLFVLSVCGNLIIVVVMRKSDHRHSSTSIIFTSLAISDMFLTAFAPGQQIFITLFGFGYFHTLSIEPYLMQIIMPSFSGISSWLLVLVAYERMVCVAFPHRRLQIFSERNTQLLVAFIWIFIFAFNTTFVSVFFKFEQNNQPGPKRELHSNQVTFAFNWTSKALRFLLPGLQIVTLNVIVLRYIRNNSRLSSRSRSVTFTLVCVCFVFIATMSPREMYVLFVGQYMENPADPKAEPGLILYGILEYLQFWNAALNFYVYILSGSQFRNDVKRLLTLPCKSPNCGNAQTERTAMQTERPTVQTERTNLQIEHPTVETERTVEP